MSARFSVPRRFTHSTLSQARCAARAALAAFGVVAMSGLAAPGASAQGAYLSARAFYDEPDMLIPPRVVVFRLQDRGFTEIGRPRFDGTAYIIDATTPSGTRARLFVDARDGAIVGRQRLDIPYYPSARPNRPAPGYGWTEDDARPGRSARTPDGLVPPADIPGVPPRAARTEANMTAPTPGRPGGDVNPLGINPDGKARVLPTPRKSAKLAPPVKPVAPSAAPITPAPRVESGEAPKPDTAPIPETAKLEQPKVDAAKPDQPAPDTAKAAIGQEPTTPAAHQPAAGEQATEATPKAAAPKQDQAWKDPPSDEAKRKVRVIDGATIVPGTSESGAPSAN